MKPSLLYVFLNIFNNPLLVQGGNAEMILNQSPTQMLVVMWMNWMMLPAVNEQIKLDDESSCEWIDDDSSCEWIDDDSSCEWTDQIGWSQNRSSWMMIPTVNEQIKLVMIPEQIKLDDDSNCKWTDQIDDEQIKLMILTANPTVNEQIKLMILTANPTVNEQIKLMMISEQIKLDDNS